MSENVYVPGDIWEDGDGDEWEVQEGGTLYSSALDWQRIPEHVKTLWGPLVLKTPVEVAENPCAAVKPHGYMGATTNRPMTEWERQILARHGKDAHEHLKSYEEEPAYGWVSSDYWNDAKLFRLSQETLNKLDDVFIGFAIQTFEEALELLLKKNADYGSKNISESPGGPLNGLRVRMWDKMARINNLLDSGVEPENESLRDSFQDIANYGLIAMMVLDGKWPGASKASAGRTEDSS